MALWRKKTDSSERPENRNAWFWIPSLYFAEGIPYVVVMLVSVIMYKRMGISNTDIALYTSWLYLPWVIKPLWSPLVDILRTKRFWIITMQLIVGAALGGVALTIPLPAFFKYTLAFFWLMAFSSATHDIAADGFYMMGLNEHDQAWFVGVRSTFYRAAMITGQGLLIILAGYIESHSGLPPVNVYVHSQPSATVTTSFPDTTLQSAESGPLHIIATSDTLTISTQKINGKTANSFRFWAHHYNVRHGFYREERRVEGKKATMPANNSWWNSDVVQPLETFIKSHFGVTRKKFTSQNEAGNIRIIAFHLSAQPKAGKIISVNFGRETGNQNISLVEGTRFEFTAKNWNRPALAVFQLDPKLNNRVTTHFKATAGNIPLAWSVTFLILTGLFIVFFLYHKFILPYPSNDRTVLTSGSPYDEFFKTFASFFRKEKIGVILAFLLLYRLGESQLVKLASPFLLDAQEAGGLALTTAEVGFVYGTVGILALTVGGIIGGFLAARDGLKKWLWWMVIAMNIPNAVYIYLATVVPHNFLTINICVALEQFGYGFGFTAYMLYMIYVSQGDHKTAHFAITTGFMALGMMLPGMVSGWIEDLIGYQHFFIWVMIATIPAFIVTWFIPLDPEFGKKKKE